MKRVPFIHSVGPTSGIARFNDRLIFLRVLDLWQRDLFVQQKPWSNISRKFGGYKVRMTEQI